MAVGTYFMYREYDDVLHGGPNHTRAANATSLRCLRYSQGVGERWMRTAVALLSFQVVAVVVTAAFACYTLGGCVTCICGPPKERPSWATKVLYCIVAIALAAASVLLVRHNADCKQLMTGLLLVLLSSVGGLAGIYLLCKAPVFTSLPPEPLINE